jgi:hypothetical protein
MLVYGGHMQLPVSIQGIGTQFSGLDNGHYSILTSLLVRYRDWIQIILRDDVIRLSRTVLGPPAYQ